jgi:hypothetical protein
MTSHSSDPLPQSHVQPWSPADAVVRSHTATSHPVGLAALRRPIGRVALLLTAACVLLAPSQALARSLTPPSPPQREKTPEPDPYARYERYADPEEVGGAWLTDRLAPRPLPDDPAPADYGEQDCYQICMACHGDQGQGLTDEWREAWDGDSYCWESK